MSEEEDLDYIIVTVEDNHDDNTSDEDAVTKEDSKTENSANADNSGDASIIQPNFESGDENYQHLFSISDGFEDTEVQHDQLVSQMSSPTNLKRYMPESTEQYCSSNKRGRTSPPKQDDTYSPRQHNMGKCMFEKFYQEYHQNQLRAFQLCFQGLKELVQDMNRQMFQLNEILSAMAEFWEMPLMTQHENGSPSLPVARQTTQAQANVPGISLQSAASPQLQEPFVAVPIVVPLPGSTSVANNPDEMTYSDILRNKGMSPDSTLPSACILLDFGMPGIAETSSEDNPETKNDPPIMGNDDDQCPLSSSANSSSESNTDKAVPLQIPEKADANLKDNDGTMYFSALLGNFTDLTSELSSATTSSSVVGGNFILLEIPSNMENIPENNLEIISCSSSLESDRDQSSSFSVLCICPNCGMLKEEDSNLVKSRWPMNKLRIVESDSDLSSYSSISSASSPESSSETRPTSPDGPNLMENDSDQNNNTESASISSSIEILVETETNMESSPGTMNHPDLLRSCDCQQPSSSSSSHPHSFGYFGNPSRHIKIPNSVMETANSMCHPQQSAKYLLHHLFTEDVLLRSNVHGSLEQGLCALDSNRINALREFLQDNYPVYDLTENGYDWMLCVIAIDNYIWNFRSQVKKTTIKLQKQLSKSRDGDEADSSI